MRKFFERWRQRYLAMTNQPDRRRLAPVSIRLTPNPLDAEVIVNGKSRQDLFSIAFEFNARHPAKVRLSFLSEEYGVITYSMAVRVPFWLMGELLTSSAQERLRAKEIGLID